MNLIISSLSVSDTIQFSPCQNVLVKSRSAVSGRKDLSPCLLRATRHLPAIFCHAGLGTTHLPDWRAAWDVLLLPSHLLCNTPCLGLAMAQPCADLHHLLKLSPQNICFLLFLERTLLSCKLDLEISVHYGIHLTDCWITELGKHLIVFCLSLLWYRFLFLIHLYISEIVWLLLWTEWASDEHTTWIWSMYIFSLHYYDTAPWIRSNCLAHQI